MSETDRSSEKLIELRNILNESEQRDILNIQEKVKNIEEELLSDIRIKEVLNKEIKQAKEDPKSQIREVVSELIPNSLSSHIKKKPDTIINALYPVIGSIVSKYVTEALKDFMDTINTKIEKQLPYQRITRSLKAKIKGVSEEELIFMEAQKVRINGVLMIEKGSGIIVDNYFDSDFQALNPDLFAGLLIALQSFGRDCIDETEAGNLDQIEYGENKVLIESAGSIIMTILVKGDISSKLLKNLRLVFSNIIKEHSEFLESYNGNSSSIPQTLSSSLKELVENHTVEEEKQKKFSILKFIIPVIFILLVVLGYYYYTQKKKVSDILTTHLVYRHLPLKFHLRFMKGFSLEGSVSSNQEKSKLIQFLKDHNIENLEYYNLKVNRDKTLEINNRLRNFITQVREIKGVTLKITAKKKLFINGVVDSLQTKGLIQDKANLHFPQSEIHHEVLINPSLFSTILYFANGQKDLNLKAKEDLKKFVKSKLKGTAYFNITSISNPLGTAQGKARVLSSRNSIIRAYLNELGVPNEKIKEKASLNGEGLILDQQLVNLIESSGINFSLIEKNHSFH